MRPVAGIALALTYVAAAGCGSSREATAEVQPGEKPPIPRIIAPANGDHTGSSRTEARDALRPVFSWERVDFERPVSFDLVIDDSCEPGAMQACRFSSPELRRTGIVDFHFQPGADLRVSAEKPLGRRYYWRLRACAAGDCSPWTRVRYLEVGRARGDFDGDGYSDLAVGAPLVDNGGQDRGVVFVYAGHREGVGAPDRLDDPFASDGASFGVSVAMAGDVNGDGFADLVVGAAGQNDARGSAYVYLGGVTGLSRRRFTRIRNPEAVADDWFGAAVAGAGDIDGDGYDDVVVGASGENRDGEDFGVAYLYRGGPDGVDRAEPSVLGITSLRDFDHFGFAVAGAGDLDGDGYDDVAVGSPGIDVAGDAAGVDRGSVYLFHGSPDGILRVSRSRLEAPVPLDHDRFGYAVASAGDLDGDGFADLVIGAPGSDRAAGDAGTAYVYRGSAAGLTPTPAAVLHDPHTEARQQFGTSVAGIGDADRDGYDDIVVGASGPNRGRAIVYRGTREGVSRTPVAVLRDPLSNTSSDFAAYVTGAGDINGDGYDDLGIGASGAHGVGRFQGAAVLYPGSERGIDPMMPLQLDDPAGGSYDHFGHVVAGR